MITSVKFEVIRVKGNYKISKYGEKLRKFGRQAVI